MHFALSLNQLAHYPAPAALEDVSTQPVSHLAHLLTKMMAPIFCRDFWKAPRRELVYANGRVDHKPSAESYSEIAAMSSLCVEPHVACCSSLSCWDHWPHQRATQCMDASVHACMSRCRGARKPKARLPTQCHSGGTRLCRLDIYVFVVIWIEFP